MDRVSAGAGGLVGCCGLGWTGLGEVVANGRLRGFREKMDTFTAELNVKWAEEEDNKGSWVSSLWDHIVSPQKT